MANGDSEAFQNIKDSLRNEVKPAWNTEEAVEFKGELGGKFTPEMREEYYTCMKNPQNDPASCLEQVAKKHNLGGEYLNLWREMAPIELQTSLAKIGQFWADNPAAASAMASKANSVNLGKLYKKCIHGEYSAVQQEIGKRQEMDVGKSFSSCARAVAQAKSLGKMYNDLWPTEA